jgi:ribosomal protein L16 Arg81 hydroxylase
MRARKNGKSDMTPNWQPISALPKIAYITDEMLNETQEQYETLLEAREKPHVLDDYTVDRVHSAFTTQLEDVSLFDEQLSRWKKGKLDSDQRQEVERLTKQTEELRKACQQILSLAAELKKGTINRILEKSDAELALDVLSGKLKLPKR